MDMLLLLSQQCMEVLNARHEIRATSLDISRAFDMVWHPALLTKLSSYGIQVHLHSWLADFLSCRSQCVALNGVLSSSLPVQAGVPQGCILGPVLFLVFINDLSDSLENPLYLSADDSTLCHTICHPSDQQAATSSLSADLDKITSWSNMWNMSFNLDKSHTLTMSLRKDHLEKPPSTFSKILWKKSFLSSFWVSLSAMTFPGKATFPSWPPKPVADWESSIVQSPFSAPDHIQSFHPQPDGVLLSPLGWCSCLSPFSASHCGNQGI